MLIAVNYHYIRPEFNDPYPSIFGITPEAFEAQMHVLGGLGEFASSDQIRAACVDSAPLPERAWVITFDDGLREQYEQAWPILQRLGIPAIFYVNTAPLADGRVSLVHKIHLVRSQLAPQDFEANVHAEVRRLGLDPDHIGDAEATAVYKYDTPAAARLKYLLNFVLSYSQLEAIIGVLFRDTVAWDEVGIARSLYMTKEQMAELAAVGCLGSHSHTHLPLGTLPVEAAREDMARSVSCLGEWTGAPPTTMSYPYGSGSACSREIADAAEALGIDFAFTMERAGNGDLRDPLLLGRFACNDVPGGSAPLWGEDIFERAPHRSAGEAG